MHTIPCKATLTLTRLDSELVPFDLHIDDIETGLDPENDPVYQDLQCLTTDTLPCPDAAYELHIGESVTVDVEFEISYYKDYCGEVDVELEYTSQRVNSPSVDK